MSHQEFIETANESIIFAVARAEEYGVSLAQITLWLNAMRKPVIVASEGAMAKHFNA